MPRVSVLMSSFNHEAFVAEAVRSVLAQDWQDWELITRDDGSSDRTAQIVAGFNDSRIRHLGTGSRIGGAASLNECLRHAGGEFIAVMNSDDVLLPHRLSTQVAMLDRQPQTGAAFSHAEIIDEQGRPYAGDSLARGSIFNQPNRSRHEWLRHFFLKGNSLCHPSALIRRRVFEETGPYDPMMQRLPDFDLWVRLCARHEIFVHQSPLLLFRLMADESNASADSPRQREHRAYEHSKVLARFASAPIIGQLHEILPEWIAPGDDEQQRLTGLARAALAVASSPHHVFALDCLRGSALAGDDQQHLLSLALSARPFSLLVESAPRCRIRCRRSGEENFTDKTCRIIRSLDDGVICQDRVDLPAGTERVLMEFDAAYSSLDILALSVSDGDGREIWNLANQSSDTLSLTGARVAEVSEEGWKLTRTDDGTTRLLLPEVIAQDGLRLHSSLRIRHDLHDMIREREELSKKLRSARKQEAKMQKVIASAMAWQERPWFQRIFRRWRPPDA